MTLREEVLLMHDDENLEPGEIADALMQDIQTVEYILSHRQGDSTTIIGKGQQWLLPFVSNERGN